MMNQNKALWSLIFSLCLILSLACGGGSPGGGADGPGGDGGAAGPSGGGAAAGPGGGGVAGPGSGGAAEPGRSIAGAGGADSAAAVADATESGSATTNDESNQVIEQYARDILGISVTIVGSETGEGTANVPISTDSGIDASADMTGVTYAAAIQGGAASVSLGDGEVSGDVSGDIQGASLGSYSFTQPGTVASDENSALSVLKSTFPGIADRPYASTSSDSQGGQGYTFMAQSQQQEVDVRTGQAVIIAEVALVGVTASQGQSVIYAVVGRGNFATSLAR